MIMRTALAIIVFGVLTSLSGVASAETTLSSSTIDAVAIQRFSSARPLRLVVTHTFNVKPGGVCSVSLYGTLSTVGASTAGGIHRLITKRSSKQSIKFKFTGTAVAGNSDRQTQLNMQVRSRCSSDGVTLTSNADAVNVTCDSGVSRGRFLKKLRAGLY